MKLKNHLIFVVFLFVFLVVSLILKDNKEANSTYAKSVCYKTVLDTTNIYKRGNRGIITVNDSLFLWSNCDILNYNNSFDSKIINSQRRFRLGNLKPPYKVFKKINSDTLSIIFNDLCMKCIIKQSCQQF